MRQSDFFTVLLTVSNSSSLPFGASGNIRAGHIAVPWQVGMPCSVLLNSGRSQLVVKWKHRVLSEKLAVLFFVLPLLWKGLPVLTQQPTLQHPRYSLEQQLGPQSLPVFLICILRPAYSSCILLWSHLKGSWLVIECWDWLNCLAGWPKTLDERQVPEL